jgi:hypothetical protein
MEGLTRGQLAQRAQINLETLRFYEQEGRHPGRARGRVRGGEGSRTKQAGDCPQQEGGARETRSSTEHCPWQVQSSFETEAISKRRDLPGAQADEWMSFGNRRVFHESAKLQIERSGFHLECDLALVSTCDCFDRWFVLAKGEATTLDSCFFGDGHGLFC